MITTSEPNTEVFLRTRVNPGVLNIAITMFYMRATVIKFTYEASWWVIPRKFINLTLIPSCKNVILQTDMHYVIRSLIAMGNLFLRNKLRVDEWMIGWWTKWVNLMTTSEEFSMSLRQVIRNSWYSGLALQRLGLLFWVNMDANLQIIVLTSFKWETLER